jgi:hypothetical protein
MTRDATVAHSKALISEKEGIFTGSSVVRAGKAVKRHYFDLDRRCTFIADAKLATRQGLGGSSGTHRAIFAGRGRNGFRGRGSV